MFTNIERSVDDVGFRQFISNVKVLTFERKKIHTSFGARVNKVGQTVRDKISYETKVCGEIYTFNCEGDRPITSM